VKALSSDPSAEQLASPGGRSPSAGSSELTEPLFLELEGAFTEPMDLGDPHQMPSDVSTLLPAHLRPCATCLGGCLAPAAPLIRRGARGE
jgi:hypothetical protein